MRAQGAAPEGFLAETSGGAENTGNAAILCAHGDRAQLTTQCERAPIGAKRGRPRFDAKTEAVTALFGDLWSARTRQRYIRAWRLAELAGVDIIVLVRRFARPNGTLRVAAMLRHAEDIAAVAIAQREAGEGEP